MKKYIYTGVLVLAALTANAQNKYTAKADKNFEELEYVSAISEYLEVIEDGHGDPYVYRRLGDTYYAVFNSKEAEKWYAKLVKSSDDAELYFRYAQMLKANKKYKKANTWMDKFADLLPNDERAKSHKANPNTVTELLNDKPKYKVSNIEKFNSKYSEFGSLEHNGQVYYASARSGKSRSYGWNEEPYLDIYVSDYDGGTGTMSNETVLPGNINSRFNEGTVSFSPDGKTMYFSGESYDRSGSVFSKKFKKDKEGKSTINVYSSTLVNGKWENVKLLPFNSEHYNCSGPAVSPDGKRLYFCSDMDGTIGGADIWYVTIDGGNKYGKPVNLGNTVNTEGSEMFPYISTKNRLYFASNGRPGLGMMDMFGTELQDDGKGDGKVINLGAPINSGKDDFSLTINEETKKGFFASNRDGGAGSDDIYAFEQIGPWCDVLLTLTVIDEKTGAILPGATIELFDANNNNVGTKTADEKGQVQYRYECDLGFRADANKEDYTNNSAEIEKTDQPEISATIPLKQIIKDDRVMLNPIFFELDKHNITLQGASELDKLVEVMNNYPEMIIQVESHTDSRAPDKYNLLLSDRRAKSTVQYVISKGIDAARISGSGKGETELLNECKNGVECSEEDHLKNRRSEFIIINKGAKKLDK